MSSVFATVGCWLFCFAAVFADELMSGHFSFRLSWRYTLSYAARRRLAAALRSVRFACNAMQRVCQSTQLSRVSDASFSGVQLNFNVLHYRLLFYDTFGETTLNLIFIIIPQSIPPKQRTLSMVLNATRETSSSARDYRDLSLGTQLS